MGLTRDDAGIDRIETTNEACTGKEVRGGNPAALLHGELRSLPVAPCVRIARVKHDLACHHGRKIAAQLRQRSIWDRKQDRIAERGGITRRASMRGRAELLNHPFELVWVPRGEHHLMAGLHP
ncbi:hypothetical protein C7413_112133 [Paraburkholderia silvatlantica]|nr:hypothetical protein C7411_112132 [Paraburkholderia silvatlantica]PXW37246.1 hypothetical protein C7413_112133 [Paraburkholderia silvatlantica]